MLCIIEKFKRIYEFINQYCFRFIFVIKNYDLRYNLDVDIYYKYVKVYLQVIFCSCIIFYGCKVYESGDWFIVEF